MGYARAGRLRGGADRGRAGGGGRVIAEPSGHTHENKVLACGSDGWLQRLGELVGDQHVGDRGLARAEPPDRAGGQPRRDAVDLRDADEHGRAGGVPASGTSASGFGDDELASIGRAVTMNDPQLGDGTAEGAAKDQNVELLVDDPRTSHASAGRRQRRRSAAPRGRDVILCGGGRRRGDHRRR